MAAPIRTRAAALTHRRRTAIPARPTPPGTSPDTSPLFTEAMLDTLRTRTLVARQRTSQGVTGEHRSRLRGVSPEFADFKGYSQGDDFRRIDWTIFARLNEAFVRQSDVTTDIAVHVLVDTSASMDWRSDPALPTKSTHARRIAGMVGAIALWHVDRLSIAAFGEAVGETFGPVQGQGHVVSLIRYLERMLPVGGTDIATSLDRYVRSHRRPGLLILVSDLLAGDADDLQPALRYARSGGWQVTVLQVLDPAELHGAGQLADPDNPGSSVEAVDLETGQRVRVLPDGETITRYDAAVAAWLASIDASCLAEETPILRLVTDQPFESLVAALLRHDGVIA